jgi:glycosyltransferase involved in cell wall biosynthesis
MTEISFIVPAFNEERELGATLKALVAAGNTLVDSYEIVVADDGSTDGTARIARAHGAQVITAQHRQIAATRNSGAGIAKGEIFIFVDADTTVNNDVIGAAVSAILDGAVGGGAAVTFDKPLTAYGKLMTPLILKGYMLTGWAAGCFMFCTRQAFEAIGGFDEKLFGSEEIPFSKGLKQHGRFLMLRESVRTSARKFRIYSGREHVRSIWKFLLRGREALYDRDAMHMWYDGRREAQNRGKSVDDQL